MAIKLIGIERINKALAVSAKKADKLCMRGMIEASIVIRRDMAGKVPVDTRNLEASWFTVTINSTLTAPSFTGTDAGKMQATHQAVVGENKGKVVASPMPSLIMGFSANYAAAVHEGRTKKGGQMKYKKPTAESKFFEKAINRNKKTIIALMGAEVSKI